MKYTQYKNSSLPADDAGGLLLFPGRVVRGEGAIHSVNEFLGGAAIVAGPYVMKKFVREMLKPEEGMQIVFSGSADPSEFYRISTLMKENKLERIACFGGGKALDICKLIKKENPGYELHAVPTSAATCAAFTPVSVMYDKEGSYMNTVDSAPPDSIIIDYEIMYGLPMVFFAAGAADTLAKYYETSAAVRSEEEITAFDAQAEASGRVLADRLEKTVINRWHNPGKKEKQELADINIVLSGEISCAARECVTAGLAHALSHALTHIPAARKYLHGEHIAFSLLVQEAILGRAENFARIEQLLQIMELPVKLSGIGAGRDDISFLAGTTAKICASEKIPLHGGADLLYNVLESMI